MLVRYILYFLLVLLFFIIVVLFILFGYYSFNNDELVIKNYRDEEINQVIVKYSSGKKVPIGIMKPNSIYVHNIDTNLEGSIKLFYTDSFGVKHQEVVITYFTKGYIPKKSFIIEKN